MSADGVASPVTADDLEYGEIEKDSNFMSRQMNAMSAWQDDDDSNYGDDNFDLFDGSGFGKGGDSEYNDNDDDDDANMDQQSIADAAFHERQQKIKDELDQRTGRLWTDEWIISEEEWLANKSWDDIEEWKPELATRKSLESVKVFDGGVPTLQQLSELNLPPSLSSHPGHGSPKNYAIHRKKQIRSRLRMAIQLSIHDDLQRILQMESWSDKQEAVDDLFEVIEDRVREREPVLGKLPDFGTMVENGLEQVLRMVQSRMRGTATKVDDDTDADNTDTTADEEAATTNKDKEEDILDVAGANAEELVPVFMDISNVKNPPNSAFLSESNEAGVPNLIYPLNVHHREGVGRMVEEWELAANKETKRIMMRDATKAIASKIVGATNCCDTAVSDNVKGAARVLVTGKRGVGKTAALAGIVASARVSGHIVVYLPDGDRLRKQGFYIEPCNHRKGLYNLPMIAQEFCDQLLKSHGDDIKAMTVADETMKKFLTDDQIKKVISKANDSEEGSGSEMPLTLDKVLTVGSESASLSSGCYLSVISTLMNQTEKPFTVVMDDFNCYYDHGHYFHMDYDEDVKEAIPLNKITIFKPFLDAMGLYPTTTGNAISPDEATGSSQAMMQWGSIVAGVSESKAVRRTFTKSLTESAYALAESENHPMHVVNIERYNSVEVQHILYNFEITGIGRLRFDRGNTTLNPEEVEYLRMVSGGTGQQLIDACMIP
jgi:small subunit ribosomal protein S29